MWRNNSGSGRTHAERAISSINRKYRARINQNNKSTNSPKNPILVAARRMTPPSTVQAWHVASQRTERALLRCTSNLVSRERLNGLPCFHIPYGLT